MIHSKDKNPKKYSNLQINSEKLHKIPLLVVPSSFNNVKKSQLIDHEFNIVIYANHMLRASYPAMKRTAENILNMEDLLNR